MRISLAGLALAAWVGAGAMFPMPAHAADAQAEQSTQAIEDAGEQSKAEVEVEWDPYYTDVGYNIPLTSTPIPTIASDDELTIYSQLVQGSLIPRYMVLEASVYPMPVLGTYLKSHTPGFYSQGEVGHTGVNVIESATAGFQEPWAVSALFGNVARLERPGDARTGSNMGYTGYLISGGTQHIKDNLLIADDWYELEWKVKGKLTYPDEKMDWSFRVGAKFNANHDVVNVVYLGIRRSNLDFRYPFLSWLMNSDLDVKVFFSQVTGNLVRGEFVAGKKYPVPGKGYTPTLDFGVIWASPDQYAGVLRGGATRTATLVLRPSVDF